MNINRTISTALLSVWLILATIIFMYFNSTSYIHMTSIIHWEDLIKKIPQIHFGNFIFDILYAVTGITIFSLICMGIGLIILNILKISDESNLVIGITAFTIGEILFSILFLSIISTSLLKPPVTTAILVSGSLISIIPLNRFLTNSLRKIPKHQTRIVQKNILWAVICIILLSLLLTSARLGYDAVSDYFSQSKLMASGQEMSSFFPENHMIVSSLHPDILFTILMQTFGDQSARMLSWMNGIAILMMGYAIAERHGMSINSRLYFLILMLTSTFFTDLLGDGKVELICTTPILAALYWMPVSLKSPKKGIFLLIGFLAGFSIISRLYNIFIVSIFIAIFYIIALIKSTYYKKDVDVRIRLNEILGSFLQNTLWILPPILIIGVFHLWQNWVWLGSPLAPLEFMSKLESSNWEWQFDPNSLRILRILYPLTVTFLNSPQSLGNITPLFISFLPFWIFKDIRHKMKTSEGLWLLLVTSTITLAIWIIFFYTVVEIRYVMFIWVLLFLPSSLLIEHTLENQTVFIKSISYSLIGLLVVYIALRTIFISITTYSPVDLYGQAHCSGVSFCNFFNPINELAKPGDRVFALNAYRYYFRNDLFDCSTRAHEYSKLKTLASENSPDFWVELYRQGYRFIAFEENFSLNHSRFGLIADPKVAPSWLKITVISSSGANILYQIEADSPPFQPEISCQKNSLGNWELISSQ